MTKLQILKEMIKKELDFDAYIFDEDIYAKLATDIIEKSAPTGHEELYYDVVIQFNKDAGGTVSKYGLNERDFIEYPGIKNAIDRVEQYVDILHTENGINKQNKLTYVSYVSDLLVLSAKVIIEKGKFEA